MFICMYIYVYICIIYYLSFLLLSLLFFFFRPNDVTLLCGWARRSDKQRSNPARVLK